MPALHKNDEELCDCGHVAMVHGVEGHEDYCETCGGSCSVGGFRTWQRQIDELRRRIEVLERDREYKERRGVR